jgi:hypothetical protein
MLLWGSVCHHVKREASRFIPSTLAPSVTGGDRTVEVPADRINLEFVLPNKVMVGTVNANRAYFELGVGDMAQAEAQYLGWLGRLLTHPVTGLENYRELVDTLTMTKGAIKVFCEVVGFDRDP